MARPVRVEYADAIYHVTARGNDRRRIVRDEKDRGKWLEWVERAVVECEWRVFSFALMDNHYHMVLLTSSWKSLDPIVPRARPRVG